MQIAFLIIISLIGAIYSLWTKQTKTALGLLILTIAFALQIPELVTGFWVDILMAISIILYAVGLFAIIYKKNKHTKEELVLNQKSNNKNTTIEDGRSKVDLEDRS